MNYYNHMKKFTLTLQRKASKPLTLNHSKIVITTYCVPIQSRKSEVIRLFKGKPNIITY